MIPKLGIRSFIKIPTTRARWSRFEASSTARSPARLALKTSRCVRKALFRYRWKPAGDAHAVAREAYDSELSEGARKQAVHDAITELSSLVGSIVVDVDPSDAKVTVDGRALPLSELHAGVEVNVGEHTVVADEPGYARLVRVVNVASGQKQLPVEYCGSSVSDRRIL